MSHEHEKLYLHVKKVFECTSKGGREEGVGRRRKEGVGVGEESGSGGGEWKRRIKQWYDTIHFIGFPL